MDGPVIRDNKTRPWSLFGAEAASNGPSSEPETTPSGSEPVEDDSAGEPEGTSEEVGEGSETSTESETSADEDTMTDDTIGAGADADATPKKKGRLSGMKMPSLFGKQVGVGALLLGAGLAWWFMGRGRSAAKARAEGTWSFDENVVDAPVNSDNFETATHDPNEYAPHNPTGYDPEGKPFEAEFSEAQRTKLAKKGFAMPDGSFPIRNKQDLKNAISTYGLAKNKGRAKAWIKKRAKQLNATAMLPSKWGG